MKLIELDPRWIRSGENRQGMGISFNCPNADYKIAVWFENPIDGSEPIVGKTLWMRTGETFEDLTLHPSVDCSPQWHGHVTNGEIVD
jgi:hypothetical protein